MSYERFSPQIAEILNNNRINGYVSPYACRDESAVRRFPALLDESWRSPFSVDGDLILNCPFYNRYADKTQVFALLHNDDITRRSLHIQLVSRIARTIGSALGLNSDLIEAISLGSDLGHTPFARAGEKYLDELYFSHTGKHFSHSIQSMRVVDSLFPFNLTFQVLNGIASHSSNFSMDFFRPVPTDGFAGIAESIEKSGCSESGEILPATLEACVVRISDVIAYIGKDRDDAVCASILNENSFYGGALGTKNSEIINNLTVNIIENSYGKPYLSMDDSHLCSLMEYRKINHALIYEDSALRANLKNTVRPMMSDLYSRLLYDLETGNTDSPIYKYHIHYINSLREPLGLDTGISDGYFAPYPNIDDKNLTVVDYISGMTDDYFVDLYKHFFPESNYKIEYVGYFDPRFNR